MSQSLNLSSFQKLEEQLENQSIIRKPERVLNTKKLTKEEIIDIAKGCENKQEFYTKYKKLYDYCTYVGIRKEVMSYVPHKKKWTEESLLNEAKKYNTRSEWLRKNTSSYNIALKNKELFEKCVAHMEYYGKFGESTMIKHTYELCKETYGKYDRLNDLIKNERNVYSAAIRNGWHQELSSHMTKYKGYNVKWTFEKVKQEALKYNSIGEFKDNNRGAYFKAIYSKWLMDVIGHMTGGNRKWNVDKLVEVLKKHDSKKWYKINECKAAFAYMKRHNLTNDVLNKIKVK